MNNRMIRRHGPGGIFIHWFNAVCWFFLLATGLGLIKNPDLQPLGPWWPNFMNSLFGGGETLLAVHWGTGAVWAGIWLIFILAGLLRYTAPFLRQIFSYHLSRDLEWMIKKPFQMILGTKAMAALVRPLGWDGNMPEQGFYNVGQKAAAVAMAAGGLVLVITGVIMTLSKYFLSPNQVPMVQWSITIHFIAAGLTFGVLLIHIYMAAVSREERPAFISMFTGTVPEDYAAHHHGLWYEEVKNSGK